MTTPTDPQPQIYSHINDSGSEQLDRFAISELCKGWPVYRDASEWANYRDLYTDDAYVWISQVFFQSWSGAKPIDEFIRVSQAGKSNGDFIMHRECGTLVDLSPAHNRAVGKMKATITQRFVHAGVPFDVDCDCEFVFFCLKSSTTMAGGQWNAWFVKLFYLKDRLVMVGPPTQEAVDRLAGLFMQKELEKFPMGYQYLSVAQKAIGNLIETALPMSRGELWERMYAAMKDWLDGKEIDLFWK